MSHCILLAFLTGTFILQALKAFLIAIVFIGLTGCNQASDSASSSSSQPPLAVSRIHGQTMGTTYNISFVAAEGFETLPLKQRVDGKLVAINKALSTYDPSSELSLINQGIRTTDASGTIPISESLAEVLGQSLQVFHDSQGRFDVTVGPLVNIWGFGPEEAMNKKPSDERVQGLLAAIGSEKMNLDPDAPSLALSGPLYIDLSAIAKGWAVDKIAELLESDGIGDYLVEIGGELKTRGQKPGGTAWTIAVEKPAYQMTAREGQLIIEPGDMAVATSGDYRNYIEVDGVRFSHTIDPATGYPITHNLASVTVIHPSCAMADAWATALNVAGPEEGLKLAERQQLAAYFIIREQEGFAVVTSTAFNEKFDHQLSSSDNH